MAATGVPINGSSLILQISSDAGTTWDLIGFATTATLSTTMETRDITTKTSCGWRALGEGLRSWSLSGDGLVTYVAVSGEVDLLTLFGHYSARTQVQIRFTSWDCSGSVPIAGDPNYEGMAYLTSMEQTGGVEDNGTYSFTFEGTGELVEDINA